LTQFQHNFFCLTASVGGHLLIDPNLPISSQFHTYSSSAPTRPLSLSGNVSNQLNKSAPTATTGRTPRRRTKSQSLGNGEKDLDAFKRHRELHKTLEKNRRDHLRNCFELLRIELPQTKYSKSSHINIIYCALRHIQQLKQAAIEGDIEIEKLARTRIRLENTVVQLKEDLMYNKSNVNVDKLLKNVAKKVLKKEARKSIKDTEPYDETSVEFDNKYTTASVRR